MRIDHLVVAAHDLTHLVGDVAHSRGVRADDTELNREADRRAEIEAVDAHTRFRQRAIGHGLLQPRLDALARRDVLRHDHRLRERLVRQLRIEAEPETRRTLADIGRVGGNVLVILEQRFRLLHAFLGNVERGAFRQPQLEEQLRPFRQREELLLHMTEADDRQHEHPDGRQHDGAAAAHAPFDHAAQAAIHPRLVDRVRIMVMLAMVEVRQQLNADIGREDYRDEP